MHDEADTEALLLEALRERGMRNTLPRRAICSFLAKTDGAFLTAPQVLQGVTTTVGQIDASTVYRTLDELARMGLMDYVHLGTKSGVWHLTLKDDHQHLVCEQCAKSITVPIEEFASTFAMLKEKYEFEANTRHFAILGHCSDCEPASSHQSLAQAYRRELN